MLEDISEKVMKDLRIEKLSNNLLTYSVNIQTPEYGGGEIYFDDVLIRKDGKFVLQELEGLNPENLI